jgi:hypothetical protein
MQSANCFEVRGPLATPTPNSTLSPSSIILSGRPVFLEPLSNIISRLSRRYLTVLLSLMFLAVLAGCGPASPDKAQNLGSSASVGGSPLSKQDLSPRNGSELASSPRTGPLTTTASPQALTAGPKSLGSESGAGSASGKWALMAGGSNNIQGSGQLFVPADNSYHEDDKTPVRVIPNVPEAIAQGLTSPDASARLQALNYWGKPENKAPLDPLYEAVEDVDPAVRAKATEIIERHWAAEQQQGKGTEGAK